MIDHEYFHIFLISINTLILTLYDMSFTNKHRFKNDKVFQNTVKIICKVGGGMFRYESYRMIYTTVVMQMSDTVSVIQS